jgi:hypothetical protein
MFAGEIDPEIAALLGDASGPEKPPASEAPDFGHLFEDAADLQEDRLAAAERETVDLTEAQIPKIEKVLDDQPHFALDSPDWYKKALGGEGEVSTQLHNIITKYVQAKDPKDKGVYRQNINSVYWQFAAKVAAKAASALPPEKKYLLRYGIVSPSFLSDEQRDFIPRIPVENELKQPVYYMDEWLRDVCLGKLKPSTSDEVKSSKTDEHAKFQNLQSKAQGKRDSAEGILRAKQSERHALERSLIERAAVFDRENPDPYGDFQKKALADIAEILRELSRADKELERASRDLAEADEEIARLEERMEGAGAAVIDSHAVAVEFGTVRQMAKMCVGRQGNHFPIAAKEYYRGGIRDMATRENVLRVLRWVESIDAEVFCRSHKGKLNRIVPYCLILPVYGDAGVCWEPFDRFNRATSRGRIAVPLYPKNLAVAVVTALGDLRWQVAKEKASYYWMEEGLTGQYFQNFQSKKLKGDVRDYFLEDYLNWIFKESEGTQKLDKVVRGIFWRHMPFTQEVKEKLKTRSYVYQELYQRDVNRSMSDGY